MKGGESKRWIEISASLLFVLMSFVVLQADGPSWMSITGMLFFGLCALVLLFRPWIDDRAGQNRAKRLCVITEKGFSFGRYQFPFGTMKGRSTLPFAEVDEIRLNTIPVTALVNGNELIFLTGLEKDPIREAADRHGIPVRQPLDVWELLGEEFLDTEYDDEHKERTLLTLAQAGILREEVQRIRKRLRLRMLPWTYYVMDWIYCGQYDILNVTDLLRARTYWWSMEIALRGYAEKQDQSNLDGGL
jgi:hypothetical protein